MVSRQQGDYGDGLCHWSKGLGDYNRAPILSPRQGCWQGDQSAAESTSPRIITIDILIEAMRTQPATASVQRWGCSTMRNLTEHAECGADNQSSIAACGGIELLLQALRTFPAALDIQELGLAAAASLVRDHPANGAHFGDLGGIGLILAAMEAFPGSGELQGWGLLALRNLACDTTDNCYIITATKGVEMSVAGMRRHLPLAKVQGCGCALFGNLALVSAEQRHILANGGAVGAVLGALGAHPQEATLQGCGLATLGNLSMDSEAVRAEVKNAGGLELVLKAMETHLEHAEIQRLACSALRNMAHSEGGCGPPMAALGSAKSLMASLGAHLELLDIQRPALEAIRNMLLIECVTPAEIASKGSIDAALVAAQFHGEDVKLQEVAFEILRAIGHRGTDGHRDRLADLDAAESVTEVMRDRQNNASLQASGCALLHSLAAHSVEIAESIGSLEGVEVVISALQRHTSNVEVCLPGCAALQSLTADCTDNRARICNGEGIEALVEAMGANMPTVKLQEHACGTLRNMSLGDDELRPALSALGAMDAVLQAMEEHLHDAKVQEYGLQFLERMTHDSLSDKAKAITLSGIPRTLQAMESHVDTAAVQAAGCTVLCALATETIDFGKPPPPPHLDDEDLDGMDEAGTFIAIGAPGGALHAGAAPPAAAVGGAAAGDGLLVGFLDGREMITGALGHQYALSALKEHIHDAYVQECGFHALMKMCNEPREGDAEDRRVRELRSLSDADGLDTVLNGLRAHADSDAVQEPGCAVLRAIACEKNNCKEELVRSGGPEVVVLAMETHEGVDSLQETCCAILSSVLSLEGIPEPFDDDDEEIKVQKEPEEEEEDLASSVEDTSPKSIPELLASLGALTPTLRAMGALRHTATVQQSVADLISSWASMTEDLRAQLLGPELDAMTMVLEAMRAHPEIEALQLSCCRAAISLSVEASFELQKLFVSLGGCDLMLGAMRTFPRLALMQEKACCVLRMYCLVAADMAEIAMVCGALRTMLSAMKEHKDEDAMQEHAVVVLSVFAAAPDNHSALVNEETPELVTQAMRNFPENCAIQEFGCGVLEHLPVCDLAIQNRIAELEAIELSLSALTEHKEASLAERVCAALCSLVHGNAANQLRMEEADGVKLVLKQLQLFPNAVGMQEKGWRALWAVSRSSSGVKTPLKIAGTGGVALALKAMEKHKAVGEIQAFACAVLMAVAVASPEYLERIALLGAPKLIMEAMREHEDSVLVQVFACSGMQMFAAGNEKAFDLFTFENEGSDLVQQAMQRFPEDGQMQRFGLLAIQTLRGVPEQQEEDEDAGLPSY